MVTRAELIEGLAADLEVPALSEVEIDLLLDLAGAAAHGTGDRTSAPLACYLAGLAGAGTDRAAALDRLRRRIAERAPAP